MRHLSWITTSSLFLVATASADACPLCVSETGRRVREGIFNPDFVGNIFVTLLPFPIFLAIVASIYFGPPWSRDASVRPSPGDDGSPCPARADRAEPRS